MNNPIIKYLDYASQGALCLLAIAILIITLPIFAPLALFGWWLNRLGDSQ